MNERTRTKTSHLMPAIGAAMMAIAIGLIAAFGLVDTARADLVAQSISLFPDVTDEMTQASYWSDKQSNPDEVLADRATIDALNRAGIEADGTMLQPLKDAREYYYSAGQQASLKKSAADELASEFVGKAQDENGNILTEADAAAILANYPTDGSAPNIPSQYAIVTTHTTMRCYPTNRMLGLTPGDNDDDNLYLAALRVNEPLIVRTQSVDGKFFLCISSCMGAAWVPSQDVAICANKTEWLDAWDIPAGQELVVTGYKVRTEQTRVTPNTADRMLYMGTVLERVDLSSPEEALEKVGTRSAFYNYVCYLPVRNGDGTYSKELALIAQSAEVNSGYLPLTSENIADTAFNSLGQMYGWGGMLEANDCSGYVRDVYKCFGLELARNTTWQMNLPVRSYDLSGLDDAHKAAAIAQMPLGTVLFWGGHEMLYLGQENGKLYVISSLGGIGDIYGDSYSSSQVKGVAINTLDMIRWNRVTWLSTLTYANIPYISNTTAGPSLFDLEFYEKSVTWPEAAYVYTGRPIAPDVTIPGLEVGTDYEMSFKDNTAIGTATVTLTGKGDYAGQVSRTFEIVSPSLENAQVTIADQAFTGSALTPQPTVVLGTQTLKPGRDFTVDYANNVDVGTATVTLTGAGSFTGSTSTTFRIGRASLENATVEIENQLYTGKALKPQPTVMLNGLELDPYTDYRVSYKDNVDVGTATVTLTGKGEYVGSATASFEIEQASMSTVTVKVQDQVFTGSAIEPTVLVRRGNTILQEGVDYVASYKNNVKVGTATATVTGIGSYSGQASATFKIVSSSLAKATVTVVNATYTGKAITPKPQVKAGSLVLREGTDYSVSYEDNVQVGTAIVVVKGMGNFTDSNFATFKIGKASQVISAKKSISKTFTASEKTKKLAKNKTVNLKKLAKASAKTSVRFTKANKVGGKKIAVNPVTGKVTLKKGLKTGTYKVKVKLTARANASYKAAKAKTIVLKVVVKG
ncbi:MAG: C40 family peptidase [Eggerthellaceae bacterium]|nr:C40 family peptidase [Eggerthellaceae bacterium]